MRRMTMVMGLFLCLCVSTAEAQELRGAPYRTSPIGVAVALPDTVPARPTVGRAPTRANLAVAGTLASVVGMAGGAFVGYTLEREGIIPECRCDDPGLDGLIYGSLVGAAIAAPLSVHSANGGRGRIGASLGAAALIAAVGALGVGAGDGDGTPVVVLATPLAQGIAAALIQSLP
jgi:hypothetical protein